MTSPSLPSPSLPPPAVPPSTARRDVMLIARREFVERGRDRSFLISAVVTVLIILAIVVLPAIFSKPTTYHIGVLGAQAQSVADSATTAATGSDVKTTVVSFPNEDDARAAVREGEVDVVLVDGRHALVKDKLKPELAFLLSQAARNTAIGATLSDAGVADDRSRALLSENPLQVTPLQPKNADDGTRQGVALLTVLVLYGQLIGYAMWVANGVVEEKASRVIEVLASTVNPRRLLTGKVVGIGGLALVQLVGISIVAVIAAVLVGKTRIPPDAYGAVAMSFVWFLAGFAFFAFLAAGAASMVSRQEDLQNIVTPLTLVLVGSLFAGLNATTSPDSTLSQVLSFVPPVSSVVMPTRFAAGGVPLWQVGASFVLLLITVAIAMRIAARIYTNSILKKRSKWREALRGPASSAASR